jgi:hypothetical protein
MAGFMAAVGAALGSGAAFTYQGRLSDGGQPANGQYDLQFRLTTGPIEANYVGLQVNQAYVPVTNGLFTVVLDFGDGVFDGSPRWLEIGVKPNGSTDPYTVLLPRQAITPNPYATFATTAAALIGNATNAALVNTTNVGPLTITGAGATNAVLAVTNEVVVVHSEDKTTLLVTGAGSPRVNGTYILNPSITTVTVWTNQLSFGIVDDESALSPFVLTNLSGTVLYTSEDSAPVYRWVTADGAAPPPSVSFGSIATTNTMSSLLVSQVKLSTPPVDDSLYVNPLTGDDLFAQRGKPDRAWKTLRGALSAVGTNDLIRLSPGTYLEGNYGLLIPDGTSIVGPGRGFCTIATGAGVVDTALFLGSRTVLSGFDCGYVINIGGGSIGFATNVLLKDLEVNGSSDALILNEWSDVTAMRCRFHSYYDAVADLNQVPGATNAPATLFDCDLETEFNGQYGLVNGIAASSGNIRMFGGSIRVRNGYQSACVIAPIGRPNSGSVELSGVNLDAASTNGIAYSVLNELGIRILARGMFLKKAAISGPASVEGDYVDNLVIGTNLTILTTNTPPLNPRNPKLWISVTNGNQSYRLPLYQ